MELYIYISGTSKLHIIMEICMVIQASYRLIVYVARTYNSASKYVYNGVLSITVIYIYIYIYC